MLEKIVLKVSDKYLTAVKSAPKNPCSSPDQIVSGISKNCFFFRICLAVTMSNSKQPGVSALSDTFWLLFSSLSLTSPNLKRETSVDYGSFWNYYDQNLPIIDHPPTPSWHKWTNSITHVRENMYTIGIFSATYLPYLVNVVKERPLGR